MWGTAFWIGATDRIIKSVAQTLVLLYTGQQFNLLGIDWKATVGLAGGAAVLSLLTSLASAPAGTPGTTSFLPGGK